jgi:integrase/recombinase XerD
MAYTVNLELNPVKNKQGKYKVIMRVTSNRKHKRKTLPFVLDRKSQFKVQAKTNSFGLEQHIVDHKQANKYNTIIHKWKDRISENYIDVFEKLSREATLDELLNLRSTSISVKEFLLEKAIENISIESHKSASYRYRKFVGWLNDNYSNILMDAIDFNIANSYVNFLKKHLQASSIRSHIKYLRSAFNMALRGGYLQANPFTVIKLPKVIEKERLRLSSEQISQIIEMDFSDRKSTSMARDIFLFQYFSSGKRIGDTLKMRFSMIEGDKITIPISKSKKMSAVHINEQLRTIINRYRCDSKDAFIFPYLRGYESADKATLIKKIDSKVSIIDRHLKEIQVKLGLGISLATHCARRSVARRHSTELQRSTDALQTVFSHSDIKVTEGYIGTEQNIEKSINESKVLFEDFPNVKLS